MFATYLKGRIPAVKKILLLALLAFAFVGGTATIVTFHPQPAQACEGSGCN
jgi:hypothetical protein